MTYILGVNAGCATFHDPSAALVDGDGTVLACVEEERLTRVRHSPGVQAPALAVAQCLRIAGIPAQALDAVAVGWDEPRMRARKGRHWEFDSDRQFLGALGLTGPRLPGVAFVPHHQAHAASAFHASGYERAAVLVIDGNGEDESTSIWRAGRGQPLIRVAAWPRICSLGHLYEAASEWLGLGKRAAGKTMGLAAYGDVSSVPDPGWLTVGPHGLISALGSDPSQDYEATRSRWRARIAAFAGTDRPAAEMTLPERDALTTGLTTRLADIPPLNLLVGSPLAYHSGVIADLHPDGPLLALREAVRETIRAVRGPDAVRYAFGVPHLSIGYAQSEASTDDAARLLRRVRPSHAPLRVDWVELVDVVNDSVAKSITWQRLAVMSLGGSPALLLQTGS